MLLPNINYLRGIVYCTVGIWLFCSQSITYSELIPVLIKAIQQQHEIIETQGEELQNLKSNVSKINELLGLNLKASKK